MAHIVPAYVNWPYLEHHPQSHFVGTIYTGEKWQCVEYVRRYYLMKYGIWIPLVKNAYHLPRLDNFWRVSDRQPVGIRVKYRDNTKFSPEPDDLLVFRDGKHGHVAVVVDYNKRTGIIKVADQNYQYGPYWQHTDYARTCRVNDPDIICAICVV